MEKGGVWGLGAALGSDFFISFSVLDAFEVIFILVLTLIKIGLLGYLAKRRWELFE